MRIAIRPYGTPVVREVFCVQATRASRGVASGYIRLGMRKLERKRQAPINPKQALNQLKFRFPFPREVFCVQATKGEPRCSQRLHKARHEKA